MPLTGPRTISYSGREKEGETYLLDLVDRNVVIAFLNQMAGELVTEAKKKGELAAPPEDEIKGAYAAARALRAAIRAIERLPGAGTEED